MKTCYRRLNRFYQATAKLGESGERDVVYARNHKLEDSESDSEFQLKPEVGTIVRITRFQAELARSGFTRARYSRLLYILLFTMALPVLHVDVNYLEEKGKYSDVLDSIWYKSCCR